MRVSDYMTREYVYANLRDGLRQTFYRMRERRIRHMPVLDEREALVGIVTDRDLRRPDWVDEEPNVTHYYLLDNSVKVEEAMTPDPVTVREDADLSAAVDLFVERGYGALPVVSAGGRLVGVLSAYDCLRALQQVLDAQ